MLRTPAPLTGDVRRYMSVANKPLGRLLFAQGEKCFFCEKHLAPGEASVEHLVATANGGSNSDENCVACCKQLNALLGRMSLKEKLRVVLNQKGQFKCPAPSHPSKPPEASVPNGAGQAKVNPANTDRLALVITDLQKRGAARPRTLKTLTSTIGALFKKELPDEDIADLVNRLQAKRYVAVVGTKVTYTLPASNA